MSPTYLCDVDMGLLGTLDWEPCIGSPVGGGVGGGHHAQEVGIGSQQDNGCC